VKLIAFDAGLFTLTTDYTVTVSPRVERADSRKFEMASLHGQRLQSPTREVIVPLRGRIASRRIARRSSDIKALRVCFGGRAVGCLLHDNIEATYSSQVASMSDKPLFDAGLLAVAHVLQNRLNVGLERGQVFLRNLPNRRNIDAHVIMNQYIAQTGNPPPWNFSILGAHFGR
jgi:hypothetical protein